jgi:hypothetical protein
MLLLTDENLTPLVAEQIQSKRADIAITSLHRWREGAFLGKADGLLLEAAQTENLTLITYDQKTIPPLLMELANAGIDHSGVIFVDEQTIASHDVGGLVKAVIALYDGCAEWDWTNRISFLDAVSQEP